jgi:uroporphyrinogen decarboxylase
VLRVGGHRSGDLTDPARRLDVPRAATLPYGCAVPDHPPATDPAPLLRACARRPAAAGTPSGRVPVWFMRQAGRSLPEYRAVRGPGSILDAIRQPDLAVEITLQPVRRYGVDAAILYSDIVVPVAAIGFGVDVEPGTGPVVSRPFAERRDLDRLRPLDPEADTPYVLETVRILAKELPPGVPLIGFAGAPFTVASYLIEGGPSRTYGRTKSLMHADPDLWHDLADRLADLAIASLASQVDAGAGVVQLFDSWAGALSPPDYERYVLPHTRRVLRTIGELGVPRIHFGVGTGELLGLLRAAGPDVVGVDWRVPLDVARARLGDEVTLQGNLDPAVCLAPWPVVERQTLDVLERNAGHPGHVFNLGHGVLPETDPGILEQVVALVHERGRADASERSARGAARPGTQHPEGTTGSERSASGAARPGTQHPEGTTGNAAV